MSAKAPLDPPLGKVVLAGAAAAHEAPSKTQIADGAAPHPGGAVSVTAPGDQAPRRPGPTLAEPVALRNPPFDTGSSTRAGRSKSSGRIVLLVGASSLIVGALGVALFVTLRSSRPDEASSSTPFAVHESGTAKPSETSPSTPSPNPVVPSPTPISPEPSKPQPSASTSPSTATTTGPFGGPPWPTLPSGLPQIPSTFPTLPSAFPPIPGLPTNGGSTSSQ